VKRFLLAFFVYNDSILTVLLFASIFANEELGMTTEELVQFFLVVQGSALVGSLLFGAITNRLGPRQTIVLTLVIWVGVTVAGTSSEAQPASRSSARSPAWRWVRHSRPAEP